MRRRVAREERISFKATDHDPTLSVRHLVRWQGGSRQIPRCAEFLYTLHGELDSTAKLTCALTRKTKGHSLEAAVCAGARVFAGETVSICQLTYSHFAICGILCLCNHQSPECQLHGKFFKFLVTPDVKKKSSTVASTL